MRSFKIAMAAFIAFLGFSYLIVSGFKESGIYYMKVGELLSSPQPQSKRVKVEGDVVRGSIKRGSELEFEITDGEKELKVIYSGVEVPPTFREGIPVVVEGKYKPERELFVAAKIITKCPSKYESREVEDDR
jgi:cytochrome c-type biogenesis protein CcmE